MRLIKPSFEIIEQHPGLEGVYKQIELAGRTCYKSEDKITEDSAKGFVDRMVKSGHGAMLEHGTVYLMLYANNERKKAIIAFYSEDPYSRVVYFYDKEGAYAYITTNYRVLVENNCLGDLQYMCEPTEYHERRYTVRFITDQGILREFTRHRVFSFAVESTRYCNYSKDKFNNEITFIEPLWLNDNRAINSESYSNAYEIFCSACEEAEGYYFMLLENGFKPQDARNVLPLSTKCEMIMTGFTKDWEHFFELRDDKAAHPQAQELAHPLHEEFISRKYISYEY